MNDDKVSDMTGENVVTALNEKIEEEKAEDEKLNLVIAEAAKRIKARRTFNDGWTVMKDVGESFGGVWPVGTLVASLKEFGEAFDCPPWVNGSAATGCTKGKLLTEFGVKDPSGREWTFGCEMRFNELDTKSDLQVAWNIKGTDDAGNVGQFLADRFQRTLATREEGLTTVFFHVLRETPEEEV